MSEKIKEEIYQRFKEQSDIKLKHWHSISEDLEIYIQKRYKEIIKEQKAEIKRRERYVNLVNQEIDKLNDEIFDLNKEIANKTTEEFKEETRLKIQKEVKDNLIETIEAWSTDDIWP